jgi:peptide/nickel transport system substrate-binding protein
MNENEDSSHRAGWGLLLTLAFVLWGCRPNPAAPPQEPGAPAQPAQEQPVPTVEEQSSITIVIAQDPAGFNAHVSNTGYEQMVAEMTMLSLTEIDPWGEVYPELAAEIPTMENGSVVIKEDAGTMDVTWKLREDVTWADGVPVTADDVLFTWEAIANPETGIWVEGLDNTDGLEKVDDHTFIVHYNSIYPNYRLQFGGELFVVWPAHYCDPTQGYVNWDCNSQPLSDGPYILKEWLTGDHLIFERNPAYYQPGKPSIDRVIVRVVPDQAVRKSMLVNGDADVAMWVTETMVEDLNSEPSIKISQSPTQRWVMRLIPNLAARGSLDPVASPHPVLSKAEVRQAIREAIDVNLITQEIFHGYSQVINTELFREPYTCDIPATAYDPEAAAALLESAGWMDNDGDGVRECHGCGTAEDGAKLSLEFMIYSDYGEELELAQQLIGEMLEKIGFEIQLSSVEGNVLWADYGNGGIEQNGDFDLNMWDSGYTGIDPTDQLYYYFYSASAEPDSGWNVGRYLNPEVDALLDQAYTLDEAQRKDLFCQIATILDRDLPQIYLFSTMDAHAYSDRVDGVQATVNDPMTWNIADWKLGK